MKKIFTSVAAAVAMMTTFGASAQTIYIQNETGWETPYMYAWGDVNDLFGGWPGSESIGTVDIDGITYEEYTVPAEAYGLTEHLIYNNGTDQLGDFDVVLNRNYYLKATREGMTDLKPDEPVITPPAVENVKLYVENLSSWTTVNVYGYAEDKPELFGGWPGAASKGTEEIKGVTYLYYEMPKGYTSYSLIFNNGEAEQTDGPAIVPSEDVFVRLSADLTSVVIPDPNVTYNYLYIKDETGWDELYVYAWGASEIFGGWPGAKSSGDTVIDGTTYKTFSYPTADKDYNLIFNNGSGTQYDATAINANNTYFITATPNEAKDIETNVAEIHIVDNTESVFYNMQGVRVMNPEKGVYIRISNVKAEKVAF